MEMSFGKHKGKPVAWVLLEKPEYFKWMGSKEMTDKSEFKFMEKIVSKFDEMPLINVRCSGTCKKTNIPTKLSLYNYIFNGEFWFCDECNPYHLGANPGKLSSVRSLNSIIGHRQSDVLIKVFSRAKGVPNRKTKNALKLFFNY